MKTGLNDYNKQEEILKRVKDREYKRRCWAVGICPYCGKDLRNIAAISSHHISLTCDNRRCEMYDKIIPNSCIK